ncbi:unnamed protein product [Lota lota]
MRRAGRQWIGALPSVSGQNNGMGAFRVFDPGYLQFTSSRQAGGADWALTLNKAGLRVSVVLMVFPANRTAGNSITDGFRSAGARRCATTRSCHSRERWVLDSAAMETG